MHKFISETAKYGDLTRGPRVVDERSQERDAQDPQGDPERQVRARVDPRERDRQAATTSELLKADLNQPIEKVGAKLRARMPWLEGTR